ncbi:MAG TPA: CDP-alcohol phosphatidyltransferase family protein [Stellaceae bacterium]|jgi:phosphatidylglycerophosphate synthase|nr:CDP-alcohol phosphatidyltransferase family protein [Stellaceae bacterium]
MAGPRRFSFADIRNSYTTGKRREEAWGEWGAAFVYRPISYVVTAWLLRWPISATTVTVAALALVAALPLIALAAPGAYAAVGAVALVVAVLDCVDGNIARVTETTSRVGHYLDFLTDVVFRIAFYAAIGVVAARQTDASWLTLEAGSLLGLAAAVLAVVARLSRVYAERFTAESVYARPSSGGSRASAAAGILFAVLSGIDPLLPVIVLVAGYFGALAWVLGWLLAYSLGDFLYSQYAILRRLA